MHQRGVALAIKTARELAMLPYQVRTLSSDKSGGRGGRGRQGTGKGRGAGSGPSANAAKASAAGRPPKD